MKPYEILEHTADVGLRVYATNLEELFTHAGLGLFDLITDVPQLVRREKGNVLSSVLELREANVSDLFLKWLRELLFLFSSKRLVFFRYDFQKLTPTELRATAWAKKFDPKRDEQRHEVKAVTYHQFKLEKKEEGWIAEIVFDI